MYLEQFWLTWNQEPWTQFAQDPLDRSSDQTTLSLVSIGAAQCNGGWGGLYKAFNFEGKHTQF